MCLIISDNASHWFSGDQAQKPTLRDNPVYHAQNRTVGFLPPDFPLIPLSKASPEKAGVGGSIPSLATI